jgi:Ion channel
MPRRPAAAQEPLRVVVSALLMIGRFVRTFSPRRAGRGLRTAGGCIDGLIVSGTIAYTLGEGWSVVDGFYFATATLTTSSIADPELTLTDPWLEVFTSFYILVGIGILVALVSRLGLAFVALRREDAAQKATEEAAG